MALPEIDRLIQQLSKLPGLGPRSSRRVALYLLKRRAAVLDPLVAAHLLLLDLAPRHRSSTRTRSILRTILD